MKSHLWLLEVVMRDCAQQCRVPLQSWSRDFETITARVEKEGDAFVTLTLPDYASALLLALERGRLLRSDMSSFKRRHGVLPLFLGGYLSRIFDSDGVLLDEPCVTAVACLLQICNMCKKVNIPCKPSRVSGVLRTFVETDQNIPDSPGNTGARYVGPLSLEAYWVPDLALIRRAAALLLGPILTPLDRKILEGEWIETKHGPGATAEHVRGNAKRQVTTWTERLDGVFPSDAYLQAFSNSESVEVCSRSPDRLVPREQERPVRVITVPKTHKGPRVIAIEPVHMQYMQQGLMSNMVAAYKASPIGGNLLFDDQTVNARLALEGSRDRKTATMDLKDASDRVPLWIVKEVFSCVPNLLGALEATRSLSADVPQLGRNEPLELRKFASMGSATCFPVEATIFYLMAVLAVWQSTNTTLSKTNLAESARKVYVFGDDIVVPRDQAPRAAAFLEAIGLKVNTRKTFLEGNFRESCGTEAFKGERVTPVLLREPLAVVRRSAEWLVAAVEFSNNLYNEGYWETARAVREWIKRHGAKVPMAAKTSPAIAYHNVRNTFEVHSWHADLHKPLVKAHMLRPVNTVDKIDGVAALRKCLMEPFNQDPEHLLRSVRSAVVGMKPRWAPAY